jgi:pimeloyl-ACP methyl ester carboxylesterase
MPRRLRVVIATLAIAASAHVAPDVGAEPASPAPGVVELPVEFTVRNSNTSEAPCASDDGDYKVQGVLVGPTSAFASGRPMTVSLYLHGFSYGGMFLWSFKPVPGYDWPVEMAKLGHVSLAIDRLGYDASGHPQGHLNCLGSSADVAHQLVQSLRSGAYRVDGGEPVSADKVVLVGHDTGGIVAEIEAYSYDDIDGLVVWGWAEQGFSPWVLEQVPERLAFCAGGGEEAESETPGGGYFHYPPTEEEVREAISGRMDPEVLETSIKMRNRNPCGDLVSAVYLSNHHENGMKLAEIEVPVLLVYSDDDLIITQEGAEQQPAHFAGTDDLEFVVLDDAGHFPMLETRAADRRQVIAGWLDSRGFGQSRRNQ